MLPSLPWQPIHPLDRDIYYILAIILDKHLFCNTERGTFRQGNPIETDYRKYRGWKKKESVTKSV
jgi:hypothetical protein